MSHCVLFVDDEPRVTDAIRRQLKNEPYRILVANSAREALDVLASEPVDVVVSDEQMPEMRGSELLSVVRRECPDTIRIILTGQARLDAAVEAINTAEIFRFLLKPCPARVLGSCIREAIEARERSRQQSRALESRGDRELAATFERGLELIWPAFQPIVSVCEGRTFAFETLVRTDEPDMKHPGDFFAAAERLGRLDELERRIRETVAGVIDCAPADALMFVNIHPATLEDSALYSTEDPLVPYASKIVLEITERASLEDMTAAQKQVSRLRELGYRIAVDDLGAGYAGLTSFALLSPDFVKFDMSLVRDVHASETKSKVIASFVSLCHELRMRCIAEGVENEHEKARLIELGCDLLQGFHFGRPAKAFIGATPG